MMVNLAISKIKVNTVQRKSILNLFKLSNGFAGFRLLTGIIIMLSGLSLTACDTNKKPPVVPDTTPPTIVSTTPADAETGIEADAKIVIEFSEAMNRQSVELAYRRPKYFLTKWPEAKSFDWDADSKIVTITLKEKLRYGESGLRRIYAYQLSTDATDLAGNALAEATTITFSTLRTFTKILNSESKLDGHVWDDGAVNVDEGLIKVGDAIYKYAKGFLSFDLKQLPENSSKILSATVSVFQERVDGSPYLKPPIGLGVIKLCPLFYGLALDKDDFGLKASGSCLAMSNNNSKAWRYVDVSQAVSKDFINRSAQNYKSQFRLEFDEQLNNNRGADMALFCAGEFGIGRDKAYRPKMTVTYLAP